MLKPSISCNQALELHGAMVPAANRKCLMPNATSTEAYSRRWQALLSESSALQKEHADPVSSWIPPFSLQQTAQLESSAARRNEISAKLARLVADWAAGARAM